MFAIGSAFALSERSLRQAEAEHAAVIKECEAAAGKIAQVNDLELTERRLSKKADAAAALLSKVPRSALVAEIAAALPAGVSLVDLSLTTPDQNRSVSTSLRLVGVAQTDVQISELANKLSRSTVLRDVNVLHSEQVTSADVVMPVVASVRRFEIEMSIDESARLIAPEPNASTAVELQPE
jgi:Tfp pilus assembly protein PilN